MAHSIARVRYDRQGRIESVEAPDSSWWIVARGGHDFDIDDEDARSIVGPVWVTDRPYPRRYVGYGAIQTVVTADEIVGVDEATDDPIISDAAVMRLAAEGREGIDAPRRGTSGGAR
jgi:hypothetical protein